MQSFLLCILSMIFNHAIVISGLMMIITIENLHLHVHIKFTHNNNHLLLTELTFNIQRLNSYN